LKTSKSDHNAGLAFWTRVDFDHRTCTSKQVRLLNNKISGIKKHSMPLMIVPMMGSLFETEPAITTRMRARFVQIDVDLGMAKWSRPTVTDGLATVNEAYGLIRNELHRAKGVGLQIHDGLLEART